MSQLNRNQFRFTILAMAVLSLGACSTTSNGFGGIGEGLGKLGDKTAELGSNAWEGTKNVLNIGTPESRNLDEVDLALMEDDADPGNAQPEAAQVQLAAAKPSPVLPRNALKPNTASEQSALASGQKPKPTKLLSQDTSANGELVVLSSNQLEQLKPQQANAATPEVPELTVADAGAGSVPLLDLTHEVTASENLWQIAKMTTGDANNWHILADINNLDPNASVFAGQQLTIPADMVDPRYRRADQLTISDGEKVKLGQPVTAAAAQAAVAQPGTAAPAGEPAAVAVKLPEAKPEPVVAVAAAEPVLALPEPTVAAAEPVLALPEPTVAAAKPVATAAEPASPVVAPADEAGHPLGDVMILEVGAGETLWDFAKRTTGDATNWKIIAIHNKFDVKKLGLIRPGQEINVPLELVRARDENGNLIAKGQEEQVPNARIGGIAPTNELAVEATAAVLTGTNQPADEPAAAEPAAEPSAAAAVAAESAEGNIKIVEAAFQDESGITPVTADSLSEKAAIAVDSNAVDSNDKKMGKVMVKGTYYPKAVYNNADFSSSLLMRVSPGTQLLVSKAIGPWLEVKTNKGVGYVHSRDIK